MAASSRQMATLRLRFAASTTLRAKVHIELEPRRLLAAQPGLSQLKGWRTRELLSGKSQKGGEWTF
jgi:hypothetical protein